MTPTVYSSSTPATLQFITQGECSNRVFWLGYLFTPTTKLHYICWGCFKGEDIAELLARQHLTYYVVGEWDNYTAA